MTDRLKTNDFEIESNPYTVTLTILTKKVHFEQFEQNLHDLLKYSVQLWITRSDLYD